MTEKESIFHQPLGEVMRREVNADFLRKELTTDFLKKEIPLGRLGFLDRDIHLRKKQQEAPVRESSGVPQVTCFACKNETPSTVSKCLHCGAHLAERQEVETAAPPPSLSLDLNMPSRSLIDIAEDIL